MKSTLTMIILTTLFTTQYDFDTTETVHDVFTNCPAGIEKRVLIERDGKKSILYICKEENKGGEKTPTENEIEPLSEEKK